MLKSIQQSRFFLMIKKITARKNKNLKLFFLQTVVPGPEKSSLVGEEVSETWLRWRGVSLRDNYARETKV